jgi:hypothetical protein
MKCWNPECESNDADEYCIAIIINPCEDTPGIQYVEDVDDEDCKQSESVTLATYCQDCGKITYRHDWLDNTMSYLSPRVQGLEPLILPKQ